MDDRKLNFTVEALKALPIPTETKRVWYHDVGGKQSVRGLAVAVLSSGRRVFYLYRKVKGKPQQVKLGEFPETTIEQARKRAGVHNVDIDAGGDPAAKRTAAREQMTFDELVTWYEENHAKHKKSGSRDRRYVELYFPELLKLQLAAITRTEVRRLHARKGAAPGRHQGKKPRAYSCNRALASVRSIFSRAIEDEMFDGMNPAEGIRFHPEESRTRRLQPDEVKRFLEAVSEAPPDLRDFVLISLMTGARRSNVMAMRWADIDFKRGEWRIPVTKNGLPQVIPLEPQEIAILKDRPNYNDGTPWVFPGRKPGRRSTAAPPEAPRHMMKPDKAWKNLLEAAAIRDFRLHDLRRTLGSLMADSGASLQIIGSALGHKSQAATLVYARLSLDPVRDAKRAALAALSASDGASP